MLPQQRQESSKVEETLVQREAERNGILDNHIKKEKEFKLLCGSGEGGGPGGTKELLTRGFMQGSDTIRWGF